MIRKYMPNHARRLDEDHPIAWKTNMCPDDPNARIGLVGMAEHIDVNFWYHCFRTDWAEKVGFDLADYDQKKVPLDSVGKVFFFDHDYTLADLEKLLIGFRDGDPDGNGKNDTISYGACKYFLGYNFDALLGAFGLSIRNTQIDGKLYEFNIAPPYKDFLKFLNRWYEMKLIDQEVVNVQYGKMWEKVEAGQIGMVETTANYAGAEWAAKRPPNTLVRDEEVGTGSEVVMISPPIGPDGHRGGRRYGTSAVSSYNGFVVGSQVSDEKLAVILQIFDLIKYSRDNEWYLANLYGKPGVHFDWQGEPWASWPVKRPLEDVPAEYPKAGGFIAADGYPPAVTLDKMMFHQTADLAALYESYLLAPRGQSMCIDPYRDDILGETQVNSLWGKYGETLNTLRDEFFWKGLVGEIDIDAEWDEYVRKWRQAGGDEIIAEMSKAPIYSELRKGNLVY